jgi:hypothetical protein
MDFGQLEVRGYRFPGAAGAHQRAGMTASLIRELGDNYEKYHASLAAELDRLGGPPDPSAYATFDDFAAACAKVEAVVHAEAALRRCHGFRKRGASLAASLDPVVPLARDGRLVSLV